MENIKEISDLRTSLSDRSLLCASSKVRGLYDMEALATQMNGSFDIFVFTSGLIKDETGSYDLMF